MEYLRRSNIGRIKICVNLFGLLMLVAGQTNADEVREADDLRDSHRPALNYPQSIEWSQKRSIENLYAYRASDVIGRDVHNAVGNKVGEVDDVIIPGSQASADLKVIIEVGGFLGIGEKLVAIPYSSLRVDPSDDDVIFYNATEKQLLSLTPFEYGAGEKSGMEIMRGKRNK